MKFANTAFCVVRHAWRDEDKMNRRGVMGVVLTKGWLRSPKARGLSVDWAIIIEHQAFIMRRLSEATVIWYREPQAKAWGFCMISRSPTCRVKSQESNAFGEESRVKNQEGKSEEA